MTRTRSAGPGRAARWLLPLLIAVGGATLAPPPAVAEDEPAAGKLLVARRGMKDPNFAETVVLLVRYDVAGALGLVINRPSERRVTTLLPEIDGLQSREDTVFLGGPVTEGELFVLFRSPDPPEGARLLFDDVCVSQDLELLERLSRAPSSDGAFRVYAGYAGWAPGQLDHEIGRGDWHIVAATAQVVLEDAPARVWPRLVPRDTSDWVRAEPGHAVGASGAGPRATAP